LTIDLTIVFFTLATPLLPDFCRSFAGFETPELPASPLTCSIDPMSSAPAQADGHPFGIDFGGTGIKGAPVDLTTGEFASERVRTPTPRPATPEAVAAVFVELVAQFPSSSAPVGVTVPGVVRHGIVGSAANIDKSFIGADADAIFTEALRRDVHVVNDADAAGLAEVQYGAAKGESGLVIVTTLGTGIGSALIYNGVLVPNSELGHLEIDGHNAESRAASSVRTAEGLTYAEWAERLTTYYSTVENLFSPDLFVVGGGVSKDADQFLPLIRIKTPIVPATLRNTAGIVGAALYASRA
jgi:polyphosphate glucokinase